MLESDENLAYSIYQLLPRGRVAERLPQAIERGLIPKTDLKHGAGYKGYCRNADIAVWHQPTERFVYTRMKFSSTFIESIVHPEDDEGFDIFTCVEQDGQWSDVLPQHLLNSWYNFQNRVIRSQKFYSKYPELQFREICDRYFAGDAEAVHQAIDAIPLSEEEQYIEFE